MQHAAKVPGKRDDGWPALRPVVDEELADQLLGKAEAWNCSARTACCPR
jgi:hypothetical protein